jgi:DNA-cytosine methyltransferase
VGLDWTQLLSLGPAEIAIPLGKDSLRAVFFFSVLDCMALTHGSLFTGIGGLDLGLEWAGFETSWQVEIDKFCNKVLAKRWPNVPRFLDVHSVGKHNLQSVDVISGGFPCQDLSRAAGGKKRGLFNRSGLWVEYARVVRELQPRWVLVENVSDLKNIAADQVLSDLEGAGYTCWSSVVGLETFGAPFKRERVFILAHDKRYDDPNVHQRLGETMGERPLPPNVQRQVEKASQNWRYWVNELGAGNARSSGDPEESESAAYTRGRGTVHGIPDWTYRLRTVGNSCTPVIPALFGAFIKNYESV